MREKKTLNMIRIVKLWQDNKAPKVYKEASNKLTKEDTLHIKTLKKFSPSWNGFFPMYSEYKFLRSSKNAAELVLQ